MKVTPLDVLYEVTHPIQSLKAVGRQVLTDLGASGPPANITIEDFVAMRPGQAARAIAMAKEEDKKKTAA